MSPQHLAKRTLKLSESIDARLARIEEKLGLEPLPSTTGVPTITPVNFAETPPAPDAAPVTAADLAGKQVIGQPPVTAPAPAPAPAKPAPAAKAK